MQPLTCPGIVRGMSRATPKTPTKTAKKPRNAATVVAKNESDIPERTWDKGVFLPARFIATEDEFKILIQNSLWDHYVYGLCLDNGAVFYVGKGVGNRAIEHSKNAANGDDSEKSRYIRHIGDRIRYTLFFQCSDDAFARGYEAYLIQMHHDVLTNIAPASSAAFEKMFQPVHPFLKALDDLEYVDRYIKRADAECRASMRSIIAKCPEVVKTMTEEEIAWAFQEEVV